MIQVVYFSSSQLHQLVLDIQSIRVAQVLRELNTNYGWGLGSDIGLAVYGQRVDVTYMLQSGDRLEVLRPLIITPMQARRLRAARRAKTDFGSS